MSNEQPTFIALIAQGYEFSARKNDKECEIWLSMSSIRGGVLERCPLDTTTEQLHAHLEVLARRFADNETRLKADPNSCTMDEMLAHQRSKTDVQGG